MPGGAAHSSADRVARAARAIDARFIGEAAIVAAALPGGAAHPTPALGSRAAARRAARLGRGAAALCGALLAGRAAPTLALAVWRAARAIDAARPHHTAGGPAGAVVRAAGLPSAALT